MNPFNKLARIIVIVSSLSGCMKTNLLSTALPPKIFTLAATNRNPIHIQVVLLDPQPTIGNQYLLLGIPFGSIESDNVTVLVQRALYTKLAVKGYTPLVDQSSGSVFGADAPVLAVRIQNPQASAFDLLVTRHLSCSLDLKAELSKPGGIRLGKGEGTFEHFGAFAFQKEMSLCFTRALDLALDRLLNDLRI